MSTVAETIFGTTPSSKVAWTENVSKTSPNESGGIVILRHTMSPLLLSAARERVTDSLGKSTSAIRGGNRVSNIEQGQKYYFFDGVKVVKLDGI